MGSCAKLHSPDEHGNHATCRGSRAGEGARGDAEHSASQDEIYSGSTPTRALILRSIAKRRVPKEGRAWPMVRDGATRVLTMRSLWSGMRELPLDPVAGHDPLGAVVPDVHLHDLAAAHHEPVDIAIAF